MFVQQQIGWDIWLLRIFHFRRQILPKLKNGISQNEALDFTWGFMWKQPLSKQRNESLPIHLLHHNRHIAFYEIS